MARLLSTFVRSTGPVAIAACCTVSLPAQVGSIPPGQANVRTAQVKGTAVIRGHVFDAENGRPLRRVVVRATAADARVNQSAMTDEQGEYELPDLPAGHYTVTASKANYIAVSYGQQRASQAGAPVGIRDGQTVDKIDLNLPHGGVITGRVVDEYGDPMPNAQVAILRSQFIAGHRRLSGAGRGALTDDLGEYRIFGLSPGGYYLSATARLGGPQDEDAPGYAVTYFPGTVNVSNAQRVTSVAGQSLDHVNLALVAVQTAQISGTVLDSNGPTMNASVSLISREGVYAGNAPVRADGTFLLRNVAPGDYFLRAQIPSKPGGLQQTAATPLTVAGQNIDGVQLAIIAPSTASGMVIVDTGTTALIPSAVSWMVRGGEAQMDGTVVSGALRDDFTFEARNALRPGVNIVGLMSVPSGFALRAVRVAGVDVADTGFVVKPNENVSGIEIELTSHPTTLSGQVTDGSGALTTNSTIVVFARDEQKWQGLSRYIRAAKPMPDGTFRFIGLPAGDYYAVALDDFEPADSGDPDVLKRLKAQAIGVALNEGDSRTLNLRSTSLP